MRLAHSQLVLRGSAIVAALATALAGSSSTGHSASAAGGRGADYWIVLASNRDGTARGYSVHPDGSRLTPLLAPGSRLTPATISADGGTIAYQDASFGLAVSRANGTGLRRLTRKSVLFPALSRDGRLLAFVSDDSTISIIGTDGRGRRRLTSGHEDSWPRWSPDGRALAFHRTVSDDAEAIVVLPLTGRPRVVARGWFLNAEWSPDGRWIAYQDLRGDDYDLVVVRPDGSRRHRVARKADVFAWSPDGSRFAVANDGRIAILDTAGRVLRRRPLRAGGPQGLSWSPDGSRLAFAAGHPSQIWVVGVDGRGLRRLSAAGTNSLVGWTRSAPVRAPARPIPRTERVIGAHVLATRARITDLAADGPRVALIVGSSATDCRHVDVWTPATKSFRRFAGPPAPCTDEDLIGPVALAGTRVAWLWTSGSGNSMETDVYTATLAHPSWVDLAHSAVSRGTGAGDLTQRPAGDGALLAFTVEKRCDANAEPRDPQLCPPDRRSGDVVAATVYRFSAPRGCPADRRARTSCPVAKADGPLNLLAVDAGRIVVRTATGTALLTGDGRVIRDLPARAATAALSGNRLAVRTATAVEVYEVDSGRLVTRLPAPTGLSLEDLDGDILVTAHGSTVTLRRLGNGRTATIEAVGRAQAQLEPPGLFVAGDRRLTFTAMADVLRRLG